MLNNFVKNNNTAKIKWLFLFLAIFDTLLGFLTLFFPQYLEQLLQPNITHTNLWILQRTGIVWLGFAFAEFKAFLKPQSYWLKIVAFLRLMDVPADFSWVILGKGMGFWGYLSLIFSFCFNFICGIVLWKVKIRNDI